MGVPELKPVKSSNIDSVGHDGDTLYVKFKGANGKDGPTYTYAGVDAVTHSKLVSHDSPGGFLSESIRGKYPHKKIEAE